VSPFSATGVRSRLWLLAIKLELITNGRWKYCEREGGELKTIASSRENSKKRKQPHPSPKHTSLDADKDKDGDEVLAAHSAKQSTTDREGDVFMEGDETAEEPGSAVVERFATQRQSVGDDVDRALSPGITQLMDGDTPARDATPTPLARPGRQLLTPTSSAPKPRTERMDASIPVSATTTPLAKSSQDKHLRLSTELGFDMIQQAREWALAGTKREADLLKFQNQLVLAKTVPARLDICQPFFNRMAGFWPKVTRAVEVQRGALKASTDFGMPEVIVAAHTLMFDKYENFGAHVRKTIETFEERRDAIKNSVEA
jgi:hypothetical protein